MMSHSASLRVLVATLWLVVWSALVPQPASAAEKPSIEEMQRLIPIGTKVEVQSGSTWVPAVVKAYSSPGVIRVELQEAGRQPVPTVATLEHVRKIGQIKPLMEPVAARPPTRPATQPVVVKPPDNPPAGAGGVAAGAALPDGVTLDPGSPAAAAATANAPKPPAPSGLKAEIVQAGNACFRRLSWNAKAATDRLTESYVVYTDAITPNRLVWESAVPAINATTYDYRLPFLDPRPLAIGIAAKAASGAQSAVTAVKLEVPGTSGTVVTAAPVAAAKLPGTYKAESGSRDGPSYAITVYELAPIGVARGLTTTITKSTTAAGQPTIKRVEAGGEWALVGGKVRLKLDLNDYTLPAAQRSIVIELDPAQGGERLVDAAESVTYVKQGPYWDADNPGQVTAMEDPAKPGVHILMWSCPADGIPSSPATACTPTSN